MFTKESIAKAEAVNSFMESIDWLLLKQQYEHLVGVVDFFKLTSGEGHIQEMGLIHLLEGLKDLAVDHFGVDKETVFGQEL